MALKKKDPNAVTPFDLLFKKNYLTARVGKEEAKRISDERYAICQACPIFLPGTKQCGNGIDNGCGCFMAAKVHLSDAECWLPEPEKKWHRVEEDTPKPE
jgi:hypothetical protein